MYLVYNIDQIHQLFNECNKLYFVYSNDQSVQPWIVMHVILAGLYSVETCYVTTTIGNF